MEPKTSSAIKAFSYPKINLALDILKETETGYHEIQTVFHQLTEPHDEIAIEELRENKIEIACDNPKIPLDDTNTVLKAAILLKKHSGHVGGAKIFIEKRIPLMSGLGGGASNAVAALKALFNIWKLKDEPMLRRIADQIGMDCAFFFDGGTATGKHFGEKITQLNPLPDTIKFEVIETGLEISSRIGYSEVDIAACGKDTTQTSGLIVAIATGDEKNIMANLHNDFEQFAFKKHPELLHKKRELESQKTGKILLCGSGGVLVRIYS